MYLDLTYDKEVVETEVMSKLKLPHRTRKTFTESGL